MAEIAPCISANVERNTAKPTHISNSSNWPDEGPHRMRFSLSMAMDWMRELAKKINVVDLEGTSHSFMVESREAERMVFLGNDGRCDYSARGGCRLSGEISREDGKCVKSADYLGSLSDRCVNFPYYLRITQISPHTTLMTHFRLEQGFDHEVCTRTGI